MWKRSFFLILFDSLLNDFLGISPNLLTSQFVCNVGSKLKPLPQLTSADLLFGVPASNSLLLWVFARRDPGSSCSRADWANISVHVVMPHFGVLAVVLSSPHVSTFIHCYLSHKLQLHSYLPASLEVVPTTQATVLFPQAPALSLTLKATLIKSVLFHL